MKQTIIWKRNLLIVKHQGGCSESWDWEGDKGDAGTSTYDPDLHEYSSGKKNDIVGALLQLIDIALNIDPKT